MVSTGTQVQVRTDRHVQLRGTYVQVCTDPELQLRTGSTGTRRVPEGVPSTTTTTKARILPLTSSKSDDDNLAKLRPGQEARSIGSFTKTVYTDNATRI